MTPGPAHGTHGIAWRPPQHPNPQLYNIPISLTRHPPRVSGTGGVNFMSGTGQLPNYLMPYRALNTTLVKITATQCHRLITSKRDVPTTHINSKYQHDSRYVNLCPCCESIRLQYYM